MGDEDKPMQLPCRCAICNNIFDRAAGRLIVIDGSDKFTCLAAYIQQTSDTEICWGCIFKSIREMSEDRLAIIS